MMKSIRSILMQDKERYKIPKRVQDVIPIKRVWTDGIFLVGNKYAKTWKFTDINYLVASREDKEAMFEKDFPAIGKEPNKPDTKPVAIGDGNWIGKRSCILKGSVLGNETVVGTRAIVSNMTVGDGGRVLPSKSEIK